MNNQETISQLTQQWLAELNPLPDESLYGKAHFPQSFPAKRVREKIETIVSFQYDLRSEIPSLQPQTVYLKHFSKSTAVRYRLLLAKTWGSLGPFQSLSTTNTFISLHMLASCKTLRTDKFSFVKPVFFTFIYETEIILQKKKFKWQLQKNKQTSRANAFKGIRA